MKKSTNCLRIMAQKGCKIAQSSISLVDAIRQIECPLTLWNVNVFENENGDSERVRTSDLMLRRYLSSKKTIKFTWEINDSKKLSTNCLRIFEQPVRFRPNFNSNLHLLSNATQHINHYNKEAKEWHASGLSSRSYFVMKSCMN